MNINKTLSFLNDEIQTKTNALLKGLRNVL